MSYSYADNTAKIKFILMVLLIIITAAPVSSSARGMTPEDVARYSYVYQMAISPDGQHIAYTKVVQRNPFTDEDGKAYRELYVSDLNGNSRPYITGKERIYSIAWSPDGKYISYLAERKKDNGDEEDNNALYRIPFEGGESEKIIQFKSDIDEYAWAPDGHKIVLLAKDSISKEREELEDKGFDQEIYEEDWRPVRVWMFDLQDESAVPVPLDLPGSASEISWSPDGTMLAMALAPTSLIDDDYMYRRVTTVDANTGKVVYQFNNPGKLGDIVWSPDSKRLAIISGEDINDPKEGEVYALNASGSELQPVIANFEGHVRDIAWLDNNTILYLADENVYSTIGTVKSNGSNRKTIIPAGRPVFEYLTLSENKKDIALRGSSYDYPEELFHLRVADKKPARLTVSNPWLSEIEFGKQEVVKYKARDDLELYGILIHPVNETPGQRYPLILVVHGGPEAHDCDAWLTWYSSPGQVGAASGYMVFYPNYRGSTGRGIEFSKMGQADYAGGEFNDLVDAVDHLVSLGLVNKDKAGITGRSYGGYATAWASTALSEHFAAGVMAVGVSDLISKFGTTDIPMEMYYVHARSWPWDKWDWYRERSPIYYAEKARTPLLIMLGEDDTRVHPCQSMELYRYLKTLGSVPVRLIFYQDEGHGTSKAAARYDTNLRIMRWMDHYLKGPGGDPPPKDLDYSALKPQEE